MHQLILIAALTAGPLEPGAFELPETVSPDPEVFTSTGGWHHVAFGVSHTVALATVFAAYTGPFAPIPVAYRLAGTFGILTVGLGVTLVSAHYLRPSVGAAWMAAVNQLIALGVSLNLAEKAPFQRPAFGSFEPDYAIAMALSAALGTVTGLLARLPPDRSEMSGWTTLLITGAAATLTGALFIGRGIAGGPADNWYVPTLFSVFVLSPVVLRLLQGFLLPDLFLTPTAVPGGGAGLSFSGTW